MPDKPYTFTIDLFDGRPSRHSAHSRRCLSSMRGQFADAAAYAELLERAGDVVLYEVYELPRPAVAGEILHGVSILHPGKVGDEYFMTKGHFHTELETAEVYHCLSGQGMMVMETPEGDWAVEALQPATSPSRMGGTILSSAGQP